MELIALIVVIEKEGDSYSAYSANLPGVTVTGLDREEVEREMLSRIVGYVDALKEHHLGARSPITVATGPVEEKMRCVGISARKSGGAQPGQCEVDADKEGLCWQHWRELYGHAVDPHHTTRCDVCGETDSNVLRHWDSPCAGKAENPEWRTQLHEIRARERALRQQEKFLEKAERAEREGLMRPTRYSKTLPLPSPHDAFSRKEFLDLSGMTSTRLNKLLREGKVDGVLVAGRMFFSRRQLEIVLKP